MKPFPRAMSAKDERARAQELAELRAEAWRRLFDYPPFADGFAERIRVELDGDDPPERELCALEAGAEALRAHDTKGTLAAYHKAAEALLAVLIRHRRESELFRLLAGAVRDIARGRRPSETQQPVLEVRSPPRGSRVFRRYARRLREVEANLTEARQRFVANNLRLVVTIAKRYNHPFLTQADLIQEGTLGLLRAVDGYDPGRGTRFSTYAAWWIKHGITRALANHGLTVRVPANVLGLRAQLVKAERAFIGEHGRSPSDKELAAILAAPVKTVTNARRAVLGRAELPREGENLADDPFDIDALLDKPVIEHEMLELVDELPGIEADVLRKRFALDGYQAMTLAEIGDEHCLSRERIRQIEKQALRRMRGGLRERGIPAA